VFGVGKINKLCLLLGILKWVKFMQIHGVAHSVEEGGGEQPLAGNAANCTRCLLQLATHCVAVAVAEWQTANGNREVKMKYYKHFYTIR